MPIKQKTDKLINIINENLNKFLTKQKPEIIYDAMAYSVNAGGKRFRPMLTLLTCEAISNSFDEAIDFSCAIEFIHTYSLIHDDLPSLDNDDFRRGNLTCHKKFGEAIAILAGDALLNLSFEIMVNKLNKSFDYKYARAMQVISNCAGVKGMIGGQVEDIISEGKVCDYSQLFYIHQNKTAKLIKASILCGAIIGGADFDILNKLEVVSDNIGFAFQIKDDILDLTSTTDILGKPVFSDKKNDKTTYVSLFGIEKAINDYNKLSKTILDQILNLGLKTNDLYEYIKKIMNRNN